MTVQQTDAFGKWLGRLGESRSQEEKANRISKIDGGLFGEPRSLEDKVCEAKID
jgi:putative component of toxin-antitoxin plasmid stabilization module